MKPNRIKRKPKLGQHFLVDSCYREIITNQFNDLSVNNIVEVGPGLGSITEQLVKKSKKYIGIELDKALYLKLKNKYQKNKNVEFKNIDAGLYKIDKENVFFKEPYVLIGNLPYYSSNLIVRNFLTSIIKPNYLVIMIQKEVAENYLSSPPKMKFLGHTVQIYSDIKKICDVPAEAFEPPPKVISSILLLETKSENNILDKPEEILSLIKNGFAAPRKTLINSLSLSLKIDRFHISDVLKCLHIDEKLRPGNLSMEQWVSIFNKMEEL